MKKKKVAIIDDEKPIARLLTIELEVAGYEVVVAHDGEKGLDLIRLERPDIVLLDLMMPKMDGFAMLEALKKEKDIKDIPIIVLTARSSVKDIQHGVDLGVADYVEKPFHAELLIKRIERLVS
jgi:DNA-binding response OmpR family regulator